jgi:hypothetical protein
MPNSYTPLTLVAGSASPNGTSQINYGPFDFEYLNKDDIKFAVLTPGPLWAAVPIASINETTKIITLSSSVVAQYPSLTITSARIYRATTTNALVDFTAGSRISEADLDTAYRQGLFAAQEASEDASGSASRAITTNSDIQDGAVTASKLATDSVEAVKIKDGVVGATKLASTLNLSGKTLTIPTASVTQAAVTQHATAIKGAIDISSGMTGVLPVANTESNVLESLYVPCDGATYALPGGSRNFTSQNVTSAQALTTSDVLISGSQITYKPPSSAKIVVYECRFWIGASAQGDTPVTSLKLYLDNTEVSNQYSFIYGPAQGYGPGWYHVKYSFRITGTGGSVSTNDGRIQTWASNKVIELRGRDNSDSNDTTLHQVRVIADVNTSAGTESPHFVRPCVGITALS